MAWFYHYDRNHIKISDETVDTVCTICDIGGKLKEAHQYCAECNQHYCTSCAVIHNNDNAKHILSQNTADSIFMERQFMSSERCLEHSPLVQDLYCTNHDVIGCKTCMTQEHGFCSDVRKIADVVKDADMDTKDIKQKLILLKSRMDNYRKQEENRLTQLHKSRRRTIENVEDYHSKLENKLVKLKEASLEEIDQEHNAREVSIRDHCYNIENTIKKLKHAIGGLDMPEQNNTQKFVSIKSAEKILKSSEQIVSTDQQSVNVDYYLNSDIYEHLERHKSFGQVHNMSCTTETKSTSSSSQIHMYTFVQSADIYINEMTSKSQIWINSSCFTVDGFLLLAERCNKQLICMNVSGQCIMNPCDLSAEPGGVCWIGPHEAAVCLTNDTLQIVNVEEKMTLSKMLNFQHACYGVAYSDCELFISDKMKAVYIYDLEGNQLRKIDLNTKLPSHLLAFDNTTDRLHIAATDSLRTYDRNGNFVSKLSVDGVKDIVGVCTDGRGTIFVCGLSSRNIAPLGQDGRIVGEIIQLTNRIDYPLSISIRDSYKLFVTFPHGTIKVFDMVN